MRSRDHNERGRGAQSKRAGAPPRHGDTDALWAGADATVDAGAHLSRIVHELNNLLDGALRYLTMARRGLADESLPPSLDRIVRQLDAAQDGLGRMSGIVRSAMSPGPSSGLFDTRPSESLVEAIMHAAESLRPLADERGVTLDVECSPRLVLAHAGALYTVLLNVCKNAIEACEIGGRVEVIAELVTSDHDPSRAEVHIDVYDDGDGPAPFDGDGPADPDRFFILGFTTKSGGAGVGLSLSADIVNDLGGTIELRRRTPSPRPDADDDPRGRTPDPGAHVAIRFPLPD